MANKTRKNIKCSYFIKRFCIEKIESLTDMSLSEINDRLMDGEGIISKDDSKVLIVAIKLQKLLRKVNFPASFNKEFHDFLLEKQIEYHSKLDFLIDKLQKGSRPVYYADLTNQKYASELKALDAFVNHDTMQAVFVTKMYDHFIVGRRGYLSYTDTLKEYALRSKQLYGSRKHKMELFYEDLGFHKLTDEEIIKETFDLVNKLFSMPVEEYELSLADLYPFDDDEIADIPLVRHIDGWDRIFKAKSIPFERRYYIMTRHKDLRNREFRDNIEFIANIPSITNGRSEQMISQLNMDIELLENFAIEKKTIKKESLKTLAISGKRLINFYNGKWMKNFAIPEL